MVAAGGGGGAPVLSSGGAGSGGCRESERLKEPGSLERAFPALSRGDPHQGVQQYPEPARNRAKEPETGYSPKRPENSLYI